MQLAHTCPSKNSDPAGTNCQEHADRIAHPNREVQTVTNANATLPPLASITPPCAWCLSDAAVPLPLPLCADCDKRHDEIAARAKTLRGTLVSHRGVLLVIEPSTLKILDAAIEDPMVFLDGFGHPMDDAHAMQVARQMEARGEIGDAVEAAAADYYAERGE
jgi:hypothetical protein